MKKYENIQIEHGAIKEELTNLRKENTSLNTENYKNCGEIAKLKSDNEHLNVQLKDKSTMYNITATSFEKAKKKIELCSEQINKGNSAIEKLKDERKMYKNKFKETKMGYDRVTKEYDDYRGKSEPQLLEIRDLRRNNEEFKDKVDSLTKTCNEQKSTIEYLNKRLNEEQVMNKKLDLSSNNFNNFMPKSKPFMGTTDYNPGPKAPSIPRSSTVGTAQNPPGPIPYQSKFQGRYANTQFTPSHHGTSPYSKYSEQKDMNTPSASSVHSINLTGMSGQNSVKSSFQINSFKDSSYKPSGTTDYTATFKDKPNFDIEKFDQNKENRHPMSYIQTTKPNESARKESPEKFKSSLNLKETTFNMNGGFNTLERQQDPEN